MQVKAHLSTQAGKPDRIGSLDWLRGVAALIVVIYHLSLVVPRVYERLWSIAPFRLILSGREAVYVFFVLSGFVLYLSLRRHDRDGWLTFAGRRITRLYPPVAAAVLLSSVLYLAVQPRALPMLQGWFTAQSWTEPPSADLLVGHLMLFDPDRFHTLDNPMWSLVVELRLSLIFPALAAAVRWRPVTALVLAAFVSLISRNFVSAGHVVSNVDLPFTLQYLDLFVLGAFMAHHRQIIMGFMHRVPATMIVLSVIAGLVLQGWFFPYVMYGTAALLVAASFSYPALARLYGLRPLRWLGERSFSLYLVHLPVLLVIVHALIGLLPIATILAIALPVCLVVAELFWLAVERPSMQLSRVIGRRLSLHRSSSQDLKA